MDELIKDKAGRYIRLYKDETFKELLETVKKNQIDVFLDKMSDNSSIEYAKSVIHALDEIEDVFQAIFAEEKVFDSKNK